ncbi:MAG TPA: S8 family serine peptidase [Mycobacteriales bacterium]|nr:S8 family serine peptidase [Mycobacteriales bacterium]
MSRRAVGLLAAASLTLTGAVLTSPSTARQDAPIEASLLGAAGEFHAFVQYAAPVTEADVAALRRIGITKLHAFKYVNAVAVVAESPLLRKVTGLRGVTGVVRDHGLDLHLDKSKKALRADKVRASKKAGGLGLTGKGVTVAVIDSGLDTSHPDFEGRVKGVFNFEGGWAFDAYQDGSISNEVAEGTGNYAAVDEVGHGTHVASTIAGSGAASSLGAGTKADYAGVAPGAKLVGFKVASLVQGVQYDFGWEANTMAAIEYLMEHNKELGVSIVHNSWGIFEVDDPDSEPIIQMVRAAVNAGFIFVFSAGNNGPDENSVGWPGAMGNVITVGSTLKAAPYAMSNFSSRGPQVDITAPGSNIVAARSKGAVIDLQNAATPPADRPFYMAISGTSMSSPHVSGVVALMKQAYPRLTGEVAEEILARTARDLGAKGKDDDYGWGFVDAYKSAQVAGCLAKVSKAKREGCFAAVRALPRSKYRSDWRTKGDEAPTANGARPSPV